MNNPKWFRRATWTDADRQDFNARLDRSRSSGNKAQYLRIQAAHLAQSGHYDGAIELLNRLLGEFPERTELASAHAQKAASLAELGHTEEAISEYRAALQAERDFPNSQTNAWLEIGWLVMAKRLTHFYDEVSQVLQEFREEGGFKFPAIEYRYFALQSLLAEARGDKALARDFAKAALTEAAKKHSGLRYHPTVALVGSERDEFESQCGHWLPANVCRNIFRPAFNASASLRSLRCSAAACCRERTQGTQRSADRVAGHRFARPALPCPLNSAANGSGAGMRPPKRTKAVLAPALRTSIIGI